MSANLNGLDTSAGGIEGIDQELQSHTVKNWHSTCRDAEEQVDRRGNQGCPKTAGNRRMERTDIRPENVGEEKLRGLRTEIGLYMGVVCGLVVRVSGYRYRGPGFDPRRYQIF